jgi:hypothetical protein
MTTFSVDPTAVRAAATQLEDARCSVPAASWLNGTDFGHATLATAAADYTTHLSELWENRLEELDEIASRLRTSADAYEQADADGAASHD